MGEVKPVMIRSMARACQVLQLLWQHEEIFKGLNAAYADDRGWERTGKLTHQIDFYMLSWCHKEKHSVLEFPQERLHFFLRKQSRYIVPWISKTGRVKDSGELGKKTSSLFSWFYIKDEHPTPPE